MATPKKSPIEIKLYDMVQLQKTSYEELCVATGICYGTIRNIFTRHIVSARTLMALKYSGIINDQEEKEYREWAISNGKLPNLRMPRARRRKADDEGTAVDRSAKPEKQADRS